MEDTSRRPTVVIADDDPAVREALQLYLSSEGFAVETVEDGAAAIARCNEGLPQLLICDIFMPEQDGLVTIRVLRQKFPQLKIIAFTGGGMYGLTDLMKVAVRMGADRSFLKPLDLTELLEAVRELIGVT